MAKKTFDNLPPGKRRAIIDALRTVFLDKPIHSISVADVVREATIARGSFYQYFDGLEDAFTTLVDESLTAFESEIMARVQGKKLPFFTYLRDAFEKDYAFFRDAPHHEVVRKFFMPNQLYTVDYEGYRQRKESFYRTFLAALDTAALDHLSTRRTMMLYYHLSHVKIQSIHKAIKGHASLTEAKEAYHWLLDVVEAGLKETKPDEKHR